MPPKQSKTSSPRQTVGWSLVLVGAMLGVAASTYLIFSYVRYRQAGTVAGFCDLGVGFNCQGAFESTLSSIFGIPISVFALAFYTAMLMLVLKVGAKRAGQDATWSLMVLGFTASTIYSLYLLYVLIFQIDVVCPSCATLDVATVLALTGALLAPGKGVGQTYRQSLVDLRTTLLGSAGFGFALVFTVTLLIAGLVTLGQLSKLNQPVAPEEAYEIVADETARQVLVGSEDAPVKGDPDAPLLIVEFSDFECPYCRRFSQTLEQLVEAYPDHVQVRFMHYPLNMGCNTHIGSEGHRQACLSAQAAVCAQSQGRFWEMHDLMFMNNRRLSRDTIGQMAVSIGMDVDELFACIDSDWSLERVRAEADAGYEAVMASGVVRFGTPYSFVNGLLVQGARTFTEMEALVLQEIESLARQAESAAHPDDTP